MMQDIITMISTLGFPIACCVAMFYNNQTTQKELTKAINDMNTSLIKILERIKIEDKE